MSLEKMISSIVTQPAAATAGFAFFSYREMRGSEFLVQSWFELRLVQ
jgi:hypothetical protein